MYIYIYTYREDGGFVHNKHARRSQSDGKAGQTALKCSQLKRDKLNVVSRDCRIQILKHAPTMYLIIATAKGAWYKWII